jgi:prepilin-type N-terminal cleavage/methylation domain-containing protein
MTGRARGFTLLELLVAISVLTVIVGIVFATFASVTDTMAIARDNADRMGYRMALRRNLTENLGAVYADAAGKREEFQLAGTDESGSYGPADTLRFCTSLPMPGAYALPGVMKVVQYSMVSSSEVDASATGYPGDDPERPGMALQITESPLAYEEGIEGAVSGSDQLPLVQLAIPVASFDVLYFDGLSQEWKQDWDSLSEQRLPWAVWVRVNFPRSEEERAADSAAGVDLTETPDVEVMASIATGAGVEGPFLDFNHARLDSASGDMSNDAKSSKKQSKKKKN